MSAPIAIKNYLQNLSASGGSKSRGLKSTRPTQNRTESKSKPLTLPPRLTPNNFKSSVAAANDFDFMKDMKSLLPGYDEAVKFANGSSRRSSSRVRGVTGTGTGVMPEAGRTVAKLNIEDLPAQFSSKGTALVAKDRDVRQSSRFGLKSRGKMSDDYDLMSKFDTAVMNPEPKLTQATAARLKTDLNSKNPRDVRSSVSRQSRTSRAIVEHSKVKTNVHDGIEYDLGFGFRNSNMDGSLMDSSKKTRMDFLDDSEKAMQIAAKQTENSIQALKKKIHKKSEEWRTEEFGWDGYHYQQPELSAMRHLETQKKEQRYAGSQQANAKLAEMSRKFRQSLKVNTDMKRAIKTPKSSVLPTSNSLLDVSSVESLESDRFVRRRDNNANSEDSTEMESASELESHSNSHNSNRRIKSQKRVQIEASAKTNDGSLSARSRKLKSRAQRNSLRRHNDAIEDENGNKLGGFNNAGVMELRSLLESGNPGSYVTISKLEKESGDDEGWESTAASTAGAGGERKKAIDFNKLKQATRFLSQSSNPKAGSRSGAGAGAGTGPSRAVKSDMATSPRHTAVAPAIETKIMSENFHSSSSSTKQQQQRKRTAERDRERDRVQVPVENFIKQRLGESIKTVDDAAMIANRLGSLMARVALAKQAEGENDNSNSSSVMDTVGLAKELRELAANIEKDNYASLNATSSLTMQTQTERERLHSKNLLHPKFTKQMSYTDQLVLRKLRAIRHDWAKLGVDNVSQVPSDTNNNNKQSS